jgi:hypothetical protein
VPAHGTCKDPDRFNRNGAWQSALARALPPELASPIEPLFIISQPASATVL